MGTAAVAVPGGGVVYLDTGGGMVCGGSGVYGSGDGEGDGCPGFGDGDGGWEGVRGQKNRRQKTEVRMIVFES